MVDVLEMGMTSFRCMFEISSLFAIVSVCGFPVLEAGWLMKATSRAVGNRVIHSSCAQSSCAQSSCAQSDRVSRLESSS